MEKAIHKNLMTSLPHSPGKDLVLGLFSEHTPEDPGLHSLEHSFTQWNGRYVDKLIISNQETDEFIFTCTF